MPTYGYECLSCDNQFETFQSIKADALTICEACGGTLRKRIYPVGISFKGTGFYVNDYAPAGASRSKSAESDSTAPAGGDAKAEASSEGTKAEPKSEAAPKAESHPVSKPESKPDAKAPAAV